MSVARLGAVDSGLPRRLSVRMSDRNYDPGALGLSDRVSVMLDGVELSEVACWDVDKGEVIRHHRRSDGSLVISGGLPTFETLRGVVEVRWLKVPA